MLLLTLDAGIKLSCVAARVLATSGRAMLDTLVGGTTYPEVLAELARVRLRSKLSALREALERHFSNHHALVVGMILAHVDYLDGRLRSLALRSSAQSLLSQIRSNCSILSRASTAGLMPPKPVHQCDAEES